ncbi:hypothetical protein ACTFAO_07465 [Sphingobacterium spiritivorum]|uniref:hypothetical protein n=1 Tax=Sphingobacterium spiritivorum TaxID=258 RepID=UPI003F75BAE9
MATQIIYYKHPFYGKFRLIIKPEGVHPKFIELKTRFPTGDECMDYIFTGRQIVKEHHKDFEEILSKSKRLFQKIINNNK